MGNDIFNLRLRDNRLLEFSKPAVMGVINTSPNSFYNPHATIKAALQTAERMVADGADILDIGGEATNPGVDIDAEEPSAQAEIERVVPVVSAIKKRFDVLLSVDTSRAAVIQAAVTAGADMMNDQRALRDNDTLSVVSALKIPICLMHFFNPIRQPGSSDLGALLNAIKRDLTQAVERCEQHGIRRDRIIIDPGFGQGNYGKNTQENFYLLAHLHEFVSMGFPVLTAWSRKSMIGDVLDRPAQDRLYGSIAADTVATLNGAAIIRTHDVKAIVDATKIAVQAMDLSREYA